jgi:hypothetical protein
MTRLVTKTRCQLSCKLCRWASPSYKNNTNFGLSTPIIPQNDVSIPFRDLLRFVLCCELCNFFCLYSQVSLPNWDLNFDKWTALFWGNFRVVNETIHLLYPLHLASWHSINKTWYPKQNATVSVWSVLKWRAMSRRHVVNWAVNVVDEHPITIELFSKWKQKCTIVLQPQLGQISILNCSELKRLCAISMWACKCFDVYCSEPFTMSRISRPRWLKSKVTPKKWFTPYALSSDSVKDSEGQWWTVKDSEAQWSTVKHSEAQWSTVKHSEAQWSTVQDSKAQWRTVKAQWRTVNHSEAHWSTVKYSKAQ